MHDCPLLFGKCRQKRVKITREKASIKSQIKSITTKDSPEHSETLQQNLLPVYSTKKRVLRERGQIPHRPEQPVAPVRTCLHTRAQTANHVCLLCQLRYSDTVAAFQLQPSLLAPEQESQGVSSGESRHQVLRQRTTNRPYLVVSYRIVLYLTVFISSSITPTKASGDSTSPAAGG